MATFIKHLIIVSLVLGSTAYSDELNCPVEKSLLVENIEILGNEKTKTFVLHRELGFQQNDRICTEQIAEGIRRIKSTGLFTLVEHRIIPMSSPGSISLNISVTEKWTTIPIFKIGSGGGVTQYTLGVYDPNLFGKFLESGAQYENIGGASSGVAWFKNPRLFDQHQGIDFQYWNIKRVRIKYDQESDAPAVIKGFLLEREKIYLEYFYELSNNLLVRLSADYNRDTFSTKVLSPEILVKLGSDPILPPATEIIISKVGFEFGKIEGEPQSLNGHILSASSGYAHTLKSDVAPFTQSDLSLVFFRPISPEWQFAQRLIGGATSANILQYWYYLGGLDRVRGYSDNRFAGRQFILSNSEFRYLMLEKSFVRVQGASFLDLAAIGENTQDLTKLKAASFGAGLRFILPQFYRFIVRLDYAKPIVKTDDMNWSFGVQQFF